MYQLKKKKSINKHQLKAGTKGPKGNRTGHTQKTTIRPIKEK